jgi:hypothetical protein
MWCVFRIWDLVCILKKGHVVRIYLILSEVRMEVSVLEWLLLMEMVFFHVVHGIEFNKRWHVIYRSMEGLRLGSDRCERIKGLWVELEGRLRGWI